MKKIKGKILVSSFVLVILAVFLSGNFLLAVAMTSEETALFDALRFNLSENFAFTFGAAVLAGIFAAICTYVILRLGFNGLDTISKADKSGFETIKGDSAAMKDDLDRVKSFSDKLMSDFKLWIKALQSGKENIKNTSADFNEMEKWMTKLKGNSEKAVKNLEENREALAEFADSRICTADLSKLEEKLFDIKLLSINALLKTDEEQILNIKSVCTSAIESLDGIKNQQASLTKFLSDAKDISLTSAKCMADTTEFIAEYELVKDSITAAMRDKAEKLNRFVSAVDDILKQMEDADKKAEKSSIVLESTGRKLDFLPSEIIVKKENKKGLRFNKHNVSVSEHRRATV